VPRVSKRLDRSVSEVEPDSGILVVAGKAADTVWV
jgi:hypothetical protein